MFTCINIFKRIVASATALVTLAFAIFYVDEPPGSLRCSNATETADRLNCLTECATNIHLVMVPLLAVVLYYFSAQVEFRRWKLNRRGIFTLRTIMLFVGLACLVYIFARDYWPVLRGDSQLDHLSPLTAFAFGIAAIATFDLVMMLEILELIVSIRYANIHYYPRLNRGKDNDYVWICLHAVLSVLTSTILVTLFYLGHSRIVEDWHFLMGIHFWGSLPAISLHATVCLILLSKGNIYSRFARAYRVFASAMFSVLGTLSIVEGGIHLVASGHFKCAAPIAILATGLIWVFESISAVAKYDSPIVL